MDIGHVVHCCVFILAWLQIESEKIQSVSKACDESSGNYQDYCTWSFDRESSNDMVCVRVTENRRSRCSSKVGIYKGAITGAPLKSIRCDDIDESSWCCNSDTVGVKVSGVNPSYISFEGYTEPYDVNKDDCSNVLTIVTPKPLPDGVLNSQALTKKICNTNIMTLVDSKPDVYRWSAATVPTCVVGYHHVGASGRRICMCVETVDYTFHDCQVKVQYFGESVSENAEQTIDCYQKKKKWCTEQSTTNIKLQAPQNSNDVFVFKIYAKPSEERCVAPASAASVTLANGLVLIIAVLLAIS